MCGCTKKPIQEPSKKESYNIIDVTVDTIKGTVEYVADDIVEKRKKVCGTCERYFSPTGQCKECGCFVALKVKYLKSSCPISKW